MKQQILVIHGGNAFETHEEYLNYLRSKETSLEKMRFKDWKANLSSVLGDEYDVSIPKCPIRIMLATWSGRYGLIN